MSKFNEDFIKDFLKQHKDTMEFVEIIKEKKRKIVWICKVCGEMQQSNIEAKFFNRNYFMCKKCATKRANTSEFTVEEVREFIESNSECRLLSKEYHNAKEKLDLICGCGEHFKTSYYEFKGMNKRQCNKCGYEKSRQGSLRNKDEVLSLVEELLGEDYEILNKEEYINMDTKLKIFHKECKHSFERTANKIINGNQIECSFCKVGTYLTLESAQYKVNKIDDTLEVVEILKDGYLKLRRRECGCEIIRGLTDLRKSNGAKCPCQTQSIGSKKIERFLMESNIEYEKEKTFEYCKNIRLLPFDFYLPQYNCCIEFDGRQHYQIIDRWGGEEGYQIRKYRDEIKNNYCKENDIILIRLRDTDLTQDKFKDRIIDKIR